MTTIRMYNNNIGQNILVRIIRMYNNNIGYRGLPKYSTLPRARDDGDGHANLAQHVTRCRRNAAFERDRFSRTNDDNIDIDIYKKKQTDPIRLRFVTSALTA